MRILALGLILLSSISANAFDHSYKEYQQFLTDFTVKIKKQVYVDYKKIKVNYSRIGLLKSQLENLKRSEFDKFTKLQKLSFLINAYNFYTISLVVEHYPVTSIKKIGPWYSTPWKIKKFNLLGQKVHLDYIEHDVIRKNFSEPLIHFALNCAAISCPSLSQKVFTEKNLDSLLSELGNSFINNENKNYWDKKNNILYVSKIFDWYGDDFKAQYGNYKLFVTSILKNQSTAKVKFLEYSWTLNDLP